MNRKGIEESISKAANSGFAAFMEVEFVAVSGGRSRCILTIQHKKAQYLMQITPVLAVDYSSTWRRGLATSNAVTTVCFAF